MSYNFKEVFNKKTTEKKMSYNFKEVFNKKTTEKK